MLRSALGLVALVMLGGFAYFSLTAKLGQRTLFGHVRAILTSNESKALVEGVKSKAIEITHEEKKTGKAGKTTASNQEEDNFTAREREELRRIIRDRMARGMRPPATATARPGAKE